MSKQSLEEEDIDPLSLMNLIGRRDFRLGGSGIGWAKNWGISQAVAVTPNQIMADVAATFGTTDDIILEAVQKKKKTAKRKPKKQAQQQQAQPAGQEQQQPANDQQQEEDDQPPEIPEQNAIDPNMFSTDFELNPCAVFYSGLCRINGRPCLFTIQDYKECGMAHLAKSADPELFELPLGRENSFEYQKGQHA